MLPTKVAFLLPFSGQFFRKLPLYILLFIKMRKKAKEKPGKHYKIIAQ